MADSKLNELSLITTPTMSSPLYTVENNSDKRMLIKDISQVIGDENIAPAYDATETYSEGGYCMQEGKLYQANQDIDTPEAFDSTKWNAVKVTEITSGASVIQLTQAEYTALSTAEKMNGSIYKITDKAIFYCLDEEYHAVKKITSADYAQLTSDEKNNGTLYVITDEETTADDIPYSSGVSVADKLGDLNGLVKIVFSGNISKTLSNGQNLAILGNEVIASADMPSGYTPITLLSSYSTNSNCIMYSYDASTVGGTGTFCFIKNNTNSSQNIVVNYRILFMKSAYVS